MKIKGIALKPAENVGGMRWSEDVLRDATETLEGVPVHTSFAGDATDQVGTVTEAEYVEGEGVQFVAEIDDPFVDSDQLIAPETSIGSITREEDGVFSVGDIGFASLAYVNETNEIVGDYEVIDDESE